MEKNQLVCDKEKPNHLYLKFICIFSFLKQDLEIQRAVANLNKVCRCGSMKEMETPNTIKRMGQKAHNRTRVLIGGKRKMRCKKCTGCKAPRCNKCIFCIKASMKKPCENRKCLFPIVPKCPCFI